MPIAEKIALVVFIVVMLASFGMLAVRAIDRMEVQDCYKWQNYEREYRLYETHPDTALKCIELGIDVHENY